MLDTLGSLLREDTSTMAPTREKFVQAEKEWDLENLYVDLASVKGKNLTPVEKLHLRGLLCGCSPTEMAERLCKSASGLEVDLSNTVYQYVKSLVNRNEEKLGNWRNICQWLDEAGYKCQATNQSKPDNSIPVDAKVHVSNINIENQTIEIGVIIQLPFPLPSDASKKDTTS